MKYNFNKSEDVFRFVDKPDKIFIPSDLKELIEELLNTYGLFCKVATGGEKFWVEVTSFENDVIKGNINNDLVMTSEHGLKDGDSIEFLPEHVYIFMR